MLYIHHYYKPTIYSSKLLKPVTDIRLNSYYIKYTVRLDHWLNLYCIIFMNSVNCPIGMFFSVVTKLVLLYSWIQWTVRFKCSSTLTKPVSYNYKFSELSDWNVLQSWLNLYHIIINSVNCPIGTFFNVVTKSCSPCAAGSYQDNEAQVDI